MYKILFYLSVRFLTAVTVFRKPNAIPLCFSIVLVLNFLLSWLLVLLPSTFFLDVLFSFLFYNKFILCLYMFQALCAHHQEVKTVYTASGVITPVGGRPVRKLRED